MEKETFERVVIQAYSAVDTARSQGKTITKDLLDMLVENVTMFLSVTLEEKAEIRAYLESHMYVEHDHNGYAIIDDDVEDREWYTNSDHGEEHFWNLYKEHLLREGSLDFASVNLLGEVTLPKLMNCLGNPQDELGKQRVRYGLVIGDVQSGKTSTYGGLICKAADAGMKVVILLAGQTETLRQQTQERMEEDIVGYTIRIDENKAEKTDRVGVGLLEKYTPIVTAYTSYQNDFKVSSGKTMSSLEAQASLVMFIVKKNVPVLERLYAWLTGANQTLNKEGKLPYSLLLIDDEADNASINTNITKDTDKNNKKRDATQKNYDPTKTNKIIRLLCEVFMNSNYVGFTATPYANIFINPEKDDSMETSDLFPKDFIYVLPTPSAYIGAMKIFGEPTSEDPNYGSCKYMLNYITDIKEPTKEELRNMPNDQKLNGPLYYKHPKEWKGELPKSLIQALRSYYLANVIRDLDGQVNAPRTMLVNVSRFQSVESYIKAELARQVGSDHNEILCNFSGNFEKDKSLQLFGDLAKAFEHDYQDCGYDINEVLSKEKLLNAIGKIRVIVVNGSKESKEDTPDYKANPSLRLIAVGGLALSRGLTLRGLMTSYFYRNTATYDTLMQMGRWFGYRPKYDRLCRIWITNSSANWYRDIAESAEELKKDLARMNMQKLTPKEFGLRVRNDDAALEITARNKMRTATEIQEILTFWGNIFETPYFSSEINANANNYEATRKLISKIEEDGISFNKSNYGSSFIANDVPVEYVTDLLKGLDASVASLNSRFPNSKIADFIVESLEHTSDLKMWDVAVIGGSGQPLDLTSNQKVKQVLRSLSIISDDMFAFTNNGVIGGANDGKVGLDNPKQVEDEYINKEKALGNDNPKTGRKTWFKYTKRKPVLLLYFVYPKDIDNLEPALVQYCNSLNGTPIMGFGVGIPGFGHSETEEHYYMTNIVYQNNNSDNDVDDEDLE